MEARVFDKTLRVRYPDTACVLPYTSQAITILAGLCFEMRMHLLNGLRVFERRIPLEKLCEPWPMISAISDLRALYNRFRPNLKTKTIYISCSLNVVLQLLHKCVSIGKHRIV